ncbi:MAG TPA: DegT/DnrJ/EryC1/StrS family aminotransferase [Baekduia sp.]
MHEIRIPWALPYLDEREIDAVTDLLRERRVSMGAQTRAFEEDVSGRVGRRHGIAVANGSVALDVAMKLAGVGPGDEVLVSALSYIATVNCILLQGATPVFCDVDPATLNIDPDEVARRRTPATRALLVADYSGSPVDYERLEPLCDAAGIALVVDGAQSLGASSGGRPACSRGLVATTSFHTAKAMLCGEGGMVFVDDDALDVRARRLRGQGEIPGRKYRHDTLASNYRMTDVQAAIGRVQVSRWDDVMARRATIAARYAELLAGVEGVRIVEHLPGVTPAHFAFAVLVADRDAVAAQLLAGGIETRSLYPVPAYRQEIPEYAALDRTPRLRAEHAARTVLNLPMYFEMTAAEVEDVAAHLIRAVAGGAATLTLAA